VEPLPGHLRDAFDELGVGLRCACYRHGHLRQCVGLLPLSVTLHQDLLLDKSWSRAFTLVVRERSSRTPSAAVTCLVPPFGKAHGSGHVFEPRTLDQVDRTRAPERSGGTAQLRRSKTAAMP